MPKLSNVVAYRRSLLFVIVAFALIIVYDVAYPDNIVHAFRAANTYLIVGSQKIDSAPLAADNYDDSKEDNSSDAFDVIGQGQTISHLVKDRQQELLNHNIDGDEKHSEVNSNGDNFIDRGKDVQNNANQTDEVNLIAEERGRVVLDPQLDVVVMEGSTLREQRLEDSGLDLRSKQEQKQIQKQQQQIQTNFQQRQLYTEHEPLETKIHRDNNVSDVVRYRLKKMGLEPIEDHEFKSPFIINSGIYKTAMTDDDDLDLHAASNSTHAGGRQVKIISFYNKEPWLNHPKHTYNRDFKSCPYSECQVDLDGSLKDKADVLLFLPGYLSPSEPVASYRPPGQIWVMFFREAPPFYEYPDKYYSDWKGVFNWTDTYRTDSDIFAPVDTLAWRDSESLLQPEQYVSIARDKTRTAAWFVSHCDTPSLREEYVREMQKYIDIDIYGKCGPLDCPRTEEDVCENMLNKSYKFYLSFENVFCDDYVTEKFYRVFERRQFVVPVVRGGADYAKYFPKGGYINTADFPNAKALALHLKNLSEDPYAYAKILQEKDRLRALYRSHDWCDVCEKIHTNTETKVIPDIGQWSHYAGVCRRPNDIL